MAGRFRGFGGPRANRRTREEGGCASSLEVAPMRQRKSGVTDAITSLQNYPKWVAPICSMRAWLTAKPDGVGVPSSGPRSHAGPTSHGGDGRMVSAVRVAAASVRGRHEPCGWNAQGCGCQTSVAAGTIFQDTRTPLPVWFRAIWWVTTQKNGASALGRQRVLGLKKYETAWTTLHKLCCAMMRPDAICSPVASKWMKAKSAARRRDCLTGST